MSLPLVAEPFLMVLSIVPSRDADRQALVDVAFGFAMLV